MGNCMKEFLWADGHGCVCKHLFMQLNSLWEMSNLLCLFNSSSLCSDKGQTPTQERNIIGPKYTAALYAKHEERQGDIAWLNTLPPHPSPKNVQIGCQRKCHLHLPSWWNIRICHDICGECQCSPCQAQCLSRNQGNKCLCILHGH